ncbi:MAG: CopG family transcriptional regulator [Deltaproteobacteria bacterium]|nr:CopG family transcriptional regulator [Deltaproteobacteria bacterium]
MAQITLYLDEALERGMGRVARQSGKSKSAWVKEAIQEKVGRELPEQWFALWGSWEDHREPRALLRAIRHGARHQARRRIK